MFLVLIYCIKWIVSFILIDLLLLLFFLDVILKCMFSFFFLNFYRKYGICKNIVCNIRIKGMY